MREEVGSLGIDTVPTMRVMGDLTVFVCKTVLEWFS
jgi:hypothetical protein